VPKEKEKGKKRPKEKEEGIEIDFGIGKLSLGGIFKGFGHLVDIATKLAEEGREEIQKTGEIKVKGLGRQARGVYGFTVRTLGGEPIIESFGNIKKTPKGPIVEEVREPIVDIFDEEDRIVVIAEIPGVEEKDVRLDLKGDILEIAAETGDRKYHKEVLLPSKVNAESLSFSYRSGVLEVSLQK
jgi:HSP20 family protein